MKFARLFIAILTVSCLAGCDGSPSQDNPPHQHTFDNEVWEYDETYHWHPSTCGHDVTSGKNTHMFTSITVEPTYESEGYTTHTCTVCGYSYIDDRVSKLEHNYSEEWEHNEFSHWHKCIDSGYEQLKGDESDHTFNNVVTDPTYETGGYTTHTCTVCGYSYKDSETPKKTITITWKNWNGSVLETDTNVPYGSTPSFDGDTPTRSASSQYTYTFSGWYPSVSAAICDAVYTAQFSETTNTYTITWKNWNGSVLETDTNVPYGTYPMYNGPTPTREATDEYTYTFSGWSPTISSVSYNTTYTAQFDATEIDQSLGLDLELSSDGTYYSIEGIGTCELKNITLPSLYKGKPVKAISSYAFEDCTELRQIIVPDSIDTIGTLAFSGCKKLTSFETRGPISSIGGTILKDCCSLESITLHSYSNKLYTLFGSTYSYHDIKNPIQHLDGYVSIPIVVNSVSSGDNYYSYGEYYYLPAFIRRVEVKSGTIPYQFLAAANFGTYIDNLPVEEIVIGDEVTSIGSCAFKENATNLKKIVIGKSVSSIGSSAFNYCYNLTNPFIIPNSVKTIGSCAIAIFKGTSENCEIWFEGTIDEFNNINKTDKWDCFYETSYSSGCVRTIHCDDGDINK